jgi:predicted HAD superfamily Cof-like phosphohydrolase
MSKTDPYQHPNCLSNTKAWFDRARPMGEITSKDFRSQLGVHFEEVAEMIKEVGTDDQETAQLLLGAHRAVHKLAEHLKKSNEQVAFIEPGKELNFLDSICDQLVTVTGVAHTCDYDVIGALNEVNRSNFSKFDGDGNPIYDPQTRKVMKGPNYSKPDLTPFI